MVVVVVVVVLLLLLLRVLSCQRQYSWASLCTPGVKRTKEMLNLLPKEPLRG